MGTKFKSVSQEKIDNSIELMKKRFLPKNELCEMYDTDQRTVERIIKQLRDDGVVVMSHDNVSGYKIDNGTKRTNVEFLKSAYKAQRKRALSALRTCTMYKKRIEDYGGNVRQFQSDELIKEAQING